MTERSYYWDGIVTGDAVLAHYTAAEFAEVFRRLYVYDETRSGRVGGGLIARYYNQDSFYVTPCAAIIKGNFYYCDSCMMYPVASSQGYFYYYTLVLRRSGSTIRQALVGPATDTYPTPQNDSLITEIPLAYIKSGYGVMTFVGVDFREITPNGFGNFRVIRRQGGSATVWTTSGTTERAITIPPKILLGAATWTGAAANSGSLVVTFDTLTPFAYAPLAFVTPKTTLPYNYTDILVGTANTTTTLTIYWTSKVRTYSSITFNWMAIGQANVL